MRPLLLSQDDGQKLNHSRCCKNQAQQAWHSPGSSWCISLQKLLSCHRTRQPASIQFGPDLATHGSHTHLVLLEVRAHPPALVISQGVPVLLEQGVDARDAPVPTVLQILQQRAQVMSKSNQL